MSAWHTVLQDASFKGVAFDVVDIDETNGKVLVEHAKPFTDGVSLEDMGTQGRQVQVSAVFWGKQYHSRLNKLLETLAENGSGVLVHPIWGRMPNMIAASWHFRHEAEYVDYATLDITFRESGEPSKIFIFENQFLMELERLIALIDRYRDDLLDLIETWTLEKQGQSALFGSILGLWSAARGVFRAFLQRYGLDNLRFAERGEFQAATFRPKMQTLAVDLGEMLAIGVLQTANIAENGDVNTSDSRSPRQRFDAMLREVDAIADVPRQVFAGVSSNSQNAQSRLQRVTWAQVQVVSNIVRLAALGAVFQAAVALIEEYGDSMNAPDLMHINRAVRVRVQAEIAVLREVLQQAKTQMQQQDSNNHHTLYESSHIVIESLRQISGSLNTLVVAAINQKPPLVVRPAPFSGVLQQIAFEFYGDIGRTDELLRLNPHITHPNFIKKGDFINGYVK